MIRTSTSIILALCLAVFVCSSHATTSDAEAINIENDSIPTGPALNYHPVRSSAVRTAFMRNNPCPSNGKTRGACPGYILDHVVPLCAGGADDDTNMQWQTREDARIKDREERRQCAKLRSISRSKPK
jgi:hypothetical protein